MTLVAEPPVERFVAPPISPPSTPAPDLAPAAAAIETPVKQMVIVNWSGELDRIWPTLILSSAAAASGVQCKVFVTFRGPCRSSRTASGSRATTGSSGCCPP